MARHGRGRTRWILGFFAAALATAGSGAQGQPRRQPAPAKGAAMTTKIQPTVAGFRTKAVGCAITVDFSSIGAGVDGATRHAMEALLEKDAAVTAVQHYLRGREGETTMCVRLRDDGAVDRLFEALKAQVPKPAQGRAVTIRTRAGRAFSNQGNPS